MTRQTLLQRVSDPADQEAWGEFFALYEPLLKGYVRRYANDRRLRFDDADVRDVVQDIFVKLYRAMPRFELDHERGRFRTWLWRVTVNAIMDRIPSRRPTAEVAGEDGAKRTQRPRVLDEGNVDLRTVPCAGDDEDEVWLQEYRAAVLRRCLEQVRSETVPGNEKKWLSFERHAIERRPAGEVASELGITANLVYQNTARVLSMVRQRCLEEFDEELVS